MSLTAAVQALDPNIDIEVSWAEELWRPVDPEATGDAIGWTATWFEDNPLHEGPEPMGDEGPLETLLPRIAEILGYPELLIGQGVYIQISGWALFYGSNPHTNGVSA